MTSLLSIWVLSGDEEYEIVRGEPVPDGLIVSGKIRKKDPWIVLAIYPAVYHNDGRKFGKISLRISRGSKASIEFRTVDLDDIVPDFEPMTDE